MIVWRTIAGKAMRIPPLAAIGIAVLALRGLSAQPAPEPPAFEVASVKPSGPQSKTIGIYTFPGGRITAENYTLGMLMEEAFSVQRFQISGGANWVGADRYDIEARLACL